MNQQQPRLVLLPGMDGTGALFAGFVQALPRNLPFHVVSYPDTITSYEEVASFLQSSGANEVPFVIVAESFSTPAAIRWAAKNPPNLKGLVLCAGFAKSPVSPILRTLCRWMAGLTPLFSSRLAIRFFLSGWRAPGPLVNDVCHVLASTDPKTTGARLRAVMSCDVRSDLSRIETPILILQPRSDRLVGRALMRDIKRLRPAAVCEIIDGPHLLLQARPSECAASIARFAETLG